VPNDSIADATVNSLESAYSCFIGDLGMGGPQPLLPPGHRRRALLQAQRVPRVTSLPPSVAANTGADHPSGLSFLNVVARYMTGPSITVHEYGNAMTYAAR
jgi:hypothetical protein